MNASIDQTIRNNIRTERILRGWSPAMLAKKVSQQGIFMDINVPWQIEHEKRVVSASELCAIAGVFEVPVETLTEPRDVEPMLPNRQIHMLARGLFDMQHDDGEKFGEEWIDMAVEMSQTVREIVIELSGVPDFNQSKLRNKTTKKSVSHLQSAS